VYACMHVLCMHVLCMCVKYMYRNIHHTTDDEDYEILRHPFNDVTSSEL
jgi:hypothetical protein